MMTASIPAIPDYCLVTSASSLMLLATELLVPELLPKLILFFLFLLFPGAGTFLLDSLSGEFCEISFHLRHPSKSISACIQPHSITFRSNQTKFTGWTKDKRSQLRSLTGQDS